MKRIELEEYEINDLIRFLEYAKNKKNIDRSNGKINDKQCQYEIGLINDLMAKIPTKSISNDKKHIVKNNEENKNILQIM